MRIAKKRARARALLGCAAFAAAASCQPGEADTAAPAANQVSPANAATAAGNRAEPALESEISSAYSALDLAACETLEIIEEGESVRRRCAGHGGVPLFVNAGDGRFDVDAGLDNDEWESLGGFNEPGAQVEWRLRGGRPFAIIYRLTLVGPDQPPGSRLAVETIGHPGAPGCQIATVDGSVADANSVAREIADRRAATFRCGADRPETRGQR